MLDYNNGYRRSHLINYYWMRAMSIRQTSLVYVSNFYCVRLRCAYYERVFIGYLRIQVPSWRLHSSACTHSGCVDAAQRKDQSGGIAQRGTKQSHRRGDSSQVSG